MEYWREGSTPTAISTTFVSDVVGQHNKIGGITFGAAFVKLFPIVLYVVNKLMSHNTLSVLYYSQSHCFYLHILSHLIFIVPCSFVCLFHIF
jgi:hypothetical protein